MPKKHTPLYAQNKPSYVHPSLQSSRSPTTSVPSEPPTVNQRIQQLRREQAPRVTPEQRDELTAAVCNRTVPPHLRRILHIPEVSAPKPKPGARSRRVIGAPRPSADGPPPPTSWLQRSRYAPSYRQKSKAVDVDFAPLRFCTLARVTNQEFQRLSPPRSLVHQCLRTFALHWEELCEYEQHYLPTLPISLKEALLSYLTIYGQKESLDFKSFKTLFQNEEGEGTLGWDEVRFLDFTDLLNDEFTISDLGRCLKQATTLVAHEFKELSLGNATPSKAKQKPLPESWEEEEDEVEELPASQSAPTAILKIPHFVNLSRLSLAHPGRWASWPELLRISPHLSKITHLSLAYWPRPSMTPNSITTSMVSNHTSVSLGGSHFYSDLDDDWHEAANILRRFSTQTYSLRWLDLEGCTWLKALTWHSDSFSMPPAPGSPDPEGWLTQSLSPGPDWNDAWRRIEYLNFFQGWIPSDNQSLQNMPAGIVPARLLRWLRETKDKKDVQWKLNANETGYAVAEWVQREKMSRTVGLEIQDIRKSSAGMWCKVDHGWGDGTGERMS